VTNYQGTDGFGNYNQSITTAKDANLVDYFNQQAALKQQAAISALLHSQEKRQMYSGTKPLIVVGGVVVAEAKDMDEAQRVAEEHAHSKGANAYILKPTRMVAPKRDVVTTDL